MPLSLKCRLDKLEHKGQITKEEHQALLKKLDGHDKQIRADAIEEILSLKRINHYDMYNELMHQSIKVCDIEELKGQNDV